jgi:glycosyltransferase involved in cell wall biosynthesis
MARTKHATVNRDAPAPERGPRGRDQPILHAFTPYGRTAGSSRARVFEWLERTSAPSVLHCYAGLPNASPTALMKRPAALLAAELALRQTARSRPVRLLLHRECSPLSRGSLERQLISNADFAVYDFDDALQWDWGEGGFLRRWAPKAPKTLAAVRLATRVIAGNSVLADWASDFNDDVIIIPSCVDPSRYVSKDDFRIHDPPRLGWIGSASEEKQLRWIGAALQELHRRTGARLMLVGRAEARLDELEQMVDRVAWSEDAQGRLLAEMDVGLMPLVDEPLERGKCGYKLLQYAAAGVPSVGSPVGVNARILADFGAPAPETTNDWVHAVLSLLEAPVIIRRSLGQHSRSIVQQRYSYAAWLDRWERAVDIRAGAT